MLPQHNLRLLEAGLNSTTPAVISVAEAAKLLGISRNLAYEAVRTGTLPSRRIGKRILISRFALDRFLNEGVA